VQHNLQNNYHFNIKDTSKLDVWRMILEYGETSPIAHSAASYVHTQARS